MKQKIFELLLIEDNQYDAELTIMALTNNRITTSIKWLRDGEQALDFLFAQRKFSYRNVEDRPNLILLDLRIPKISGMEVLKRIKENALLKTIPVVILTSSRAEADKLRSYEIGVNSYIVKPLRFSQFSESIAELGKYWIMINQPPKKVEIQSVLQLVQE